MKIYQTIQKNNRSTTNIHLFPFPTLTCSCPLLTIDNLPVKFIHRDLHLLVHLLNGYSQVFLNVSQVLKGENNANNLLVKF